MTDRALGFAIPVSQIGTGPLIPKYYDPALTSDIAQLQESHELHPLGQLIDSGAVSVATGNEIGKMAYGTGRIPFVRTSDISNWEIKTDPKQGVSREIYDRWSLRQDLRPGDILMVRDGTYLIGTLAVVKDSDLPLLYQSHLLRFRVSTDSPLSVALLVAALSSPIVQRQIRSKQFTADIIDTLGHRFRELILPIPRDLARRNSIESETSGIIDERALLREQLRGIPRWAEGSDSLIEAKGDRSNHDRDRPSLGFVRNVSQTSGGILMPKYYDPNVETRMEALVSTRRFVSIGELEAEGELSINVGIEVGKMAYGTGPIPFVRTSDISNWEVKVDPKQGVSEEVFEANSLRSDARPHDILLVRDGTYLVGVSAILTDFDSPMLYAGGLYKIRAKADSLDPYLLLALLNTPIVRSQIRSKTFTRDIIDTLGKRLLEVCLPFPKDEAFAREIASRTRTIVTRRAELREQSRLVGRAIQLAGLVTDS